MQCPSCNVPFQPEMGNHLIGTNSRGIQVFVYFQICPKCLEPVVGYREQREKERYVLSSDVEGLTLLNNKVITINS